MRTVKHVNLFHYYEDKKEVYAAFQRDTDRDARETLWWHLVLGGCAVGAAVISAHADWLWLFGGLFAVEQGLWCFIDSSNRNWFMHAIDWQKEPDRSS